MHRLALGTALFSSLLLMAASASAQVSLSCSDNAQGLTGGPGTVVQATCPAGCGSATIWGTGTYSDDSSVCSAAIHSGAITNAGGAISVTIAPGLSAYPASTQNGVTSSSWGSWNRSFTVAGAGATATAITCDTNAQGLAGASGTVHEVTCPTGCGSATIWGTGTYSDDSSVCSAAIHAGVMSSAGGTVFVTIADGLSAYPPSTQNGVTSSSWGSWSRSFTVAAAGAPTAQQLECTTNAQTLQGGPGTSVRVACGPCPTATIWGTGTYSDDSSICSAAAHAGVINIGTGGEFTVTITAGLSAYPASTQNGVTSSSWGSWNRSFTVAP